VFNRTKYLPSGSVSPSGSAVGSGLGVSLAEALGDGVSVAVGFGDLVWVAVGLGTTEGAAASGESFPRPQRVAAAEHQQGAPVAATVRRSVVPVRRHPRKVLSARGALTIAVGGGRPRGGGKIVRDTS